MLPPRIGRPGRLAHRDEKGTALKMLAGVVANIVRGDSDKKVVRVRG